MRRFASLTPPSAKVQHSIADTLQTHPTDLDVKVALVEHLRHKTKSLEYARALLRDLERKLAGEVARLGGNKGLEGIMKKLGEY